MVDKPTPSIDPAIRAYYDHAPEESRLEVGVASKVGRCAGGRSLWARDATVPYLGTPAAFRSPPSIPPWPISFPTSSNRHSARRTR